MTSLMKILTLSALAACAPKQGEVAQPTQELIQTGESVQERGNPATLTSYRNKDGCLVKTVLDVNSVRFDHTVTSYHDNCSPFPSKEIRINYPFKTTDELRKNPKLYAAAIYNTEYKRDGNGKVIQEKKFIDFGKGVPADGKFEGIEIILYDPETGRELKHLSGTISGSLITTGTIRTFDKNFEDFEDEHSDNFDWIKEGKLRAEEESDACYDNPVGPYTLDTWLSSETNLQVDEAQLYRE